MRQALFSHEGREITNREGLNHINGYGKPRLPSVPESGTGLVDLIGPVVNEAAERGMKFCHDFLNVARKEKRFQEVLQVVESKATGSVRVPNQRKQPSLPEQKAWFLALEK